MSDFKPGDGTLLKIRGDVDTLLLPILQFTVREDHPTLVPGNVVLINQKRYWIRARQPDEPRLGQEVKLVLYRDYTTRRQRQKRLDAEAFLRVQQNSWGMAVRDQRAKKLPVPEIMPL